MRGARPGLSLDANRGVEMSRERLPNVSTVSARGPFARLWTQKCSNFKEGEHSRMIYRYGRLV